MDGGQLVIGWQGWVVVGLCELWQRQDKEKEKRAKKKKKEKKEVRHSGIQTELVHQAST